MNEERFKSACDRGAQFVTLEIETLFSLKSVKEQFHTSCVV